MRVASVGTALPPHYYEQDRLIEALRESWSARHYNTVRLE